MKEKMKYSPHPEDKNKTLMTMEMVVTVRNVPLTTYMESIILNTVSNNSSKGRKAMDWVIDKFENETRPISAYLDKLKLEVLDLKEIVSDSVIKTAQISIDDLQKKIINSDPVKMASHAAQEVALSEPVLSVRSEIEPSLLF